MKYETLLKIYFELAAKRSISVHALAEKYHLSPRTIHRYLEELEKAGLPLYSKRGKNGGFAVVDSYRVSATCFTAEEYSLIVNALEAFRREVESETLDSTLNKIRAAKRGGTERDGRGKFCQREKIITSRYILLTYFCLFCKIDCIDSHFISEVTDAEDRS